MYKIFQIPRHSTCTSWKVTLCTLLVPLFERAPVVNKTNMKTKTWMETGICKPPVHLKYTKGLKFTLDKVFSSPGCKIWILTGFFPPMLTSLLTLMLLQACKIIRRLMSVKFCITSSSALRKQRKAPFLLSVFAPAGSGMAYRTSVSTSISLQDLYVQTAGCKS